MPLRLGFLLASVFFLVVNVTCAMLVQGDVGESQVKDAVLARVLVNDSLFVLCAISLAICIFKLAKMSSANVYLESKVSGQGCGWIWRFRIGIQNMTVQCFQFDSAITTNCVEWCWKSNYHSI